MSERYAAFLRGINVGNRRVSMDQLTWIFTDLGFERVRTLIASGNVVFDAPGADAPVGDAPASDETALTTAVEAGLRHALGYPVNVMLRTAADVAELIARDPFAGIEVTKQTRLYVTLLAARTSSTLTLPHDVMDGALRILSRTNREVFSVLDLAQGSGTVDAMRVIEQEYGKTVTTRNWNTILKLAGL